MIGFEKRETTTMIDEVNTMTPRRNDLVVKKIGIISKILRSYPNKNAENFSTKALVVK